MSGRHPKGQMSSHSVCVGNEDYSPHYFACEKRRKTQRVRKFNWWCDSGPGRRC